MPLLLFNGNIELLGPLALRMREARADQVRCTRRRSLGAARRACGHLFLLTRADETVRVMNEFLDRPT